MPGHHGLGQYNKQFECCHPTNAEHQSTTSFNVWRISRVWYGNNENVLVVWK